MAESSPQTESFVDQVVDEVVATPISPLRESPPREPPTIPIPPEPDPAPAPAPALRRSTRTTAGHRQTKRYHEEFHMNGLIVQWPETAEERDTLIQALVASKSDPDVLTYDQAVRDIDVESWREAMNKEIMSLVAQGTWEVVPRSQATAAGQKIIPGTWVLRRKRKPDGSISKLKARWCVRGDLQDSQDNTFAPVVRWETIRMLLYFSLFFGLKTKSIDFSNAFVQATLNDPIYVHLPRGFWHEGNDDVCCKLKKSLYGITQAPRLWFEHLRDKLIARGFRQSRYDPCLFYSKEVYLVVYVDDVIIASCSEAAIDRLIESLKVDSQLTDEGELSSFLGIQVTKDVPNKSYILTQTGLTDRIIATLGLADANPNWVPAPPDAVGSDPDGPPMKETWEYRSVIGMLLYLSTNTRPDIAFAVHQCARHSHAPKQSHAQAVKMIGRYLLRTREEGLILKPTGDLAVDCYVDADFAGLWKREDDQDPVCVKSRSGYLITLGGCPLTWTSKMQSEIALSTMEAEYIALSLAMRDLLPLRELVKEMATAIGVSNVFEIRTYSKVFEDNNGALALASSPKMTPRSKHIAVKYHFFRSHVQKGDIKIYKIDTKEQKADIFTKGLVRPVYETIRKLVMGW
jgi:Reverse transcriptase (RNA-dependent DNA polymerase)